MDLVPGILMGLVYAATPGPINVETFRQGLKGGIIAALAVQAGASIGLIGYALLALLGTGVLLQNAVWQHLIGLSGMTMLFYMGIATIHSGHKLFSNTDNTPSTKSSAKHAFGAGAALSMTNPLDIFFWIAIAKQVEQDHDVEEMFFLSGLFFGCLIASLVIAMAAGVWQVRLNCKAAVLLSYACGLILIGFGLNLGLSLGRYWMIW